MGAIGLDFYLLLWQAIAFLILVYLLQRFAYKPILKILDDRADRIRTSMEQAEEIRRELSEAQATAQQVIVDARREAEVIRTQTQQQNQRIINQAQIEAREQGQKLIREAEDRIATETERAKAELRREVGRLAILAATRVVGRELETDPKLHEQLIDDALNQAGSRQLDA